MFATIRKIHLWVGLILAVFLLVEAITGLILAEPWLVGQASHQGPPRIIEKEQSSGVKNNLPPEEIAQRSDIKRDSSSPFSIAKGLHEGRIASVNLKWLVDLVAIGIIILTITGIYLSVTLLSLRNKS
jgi:hypothetical protein